MATTILNDNSTELQEEITDVLLPDSAKMETGELRKEYADGMNKAPFNNAARMEEIASTPLNETIMKDYEFQAEELPDRKELLLAAMDTSMEITTLDNEIVNTADAYARLIANTIGRLNSIKERLARNKERKDDIEFAQNAYTGLKNVMPITEADVTGSYGYYNNTYMSALQMISQVRFSVEGVAGNGYSGNSYVLDKDGTFVETYDDRSKTSNLSDDSLITVYEYSRLCNMSGKDYYTDSLQPQDTSGKPADINNDDKNVECTITLKTTDGSSVNMFTLDNAANDLKILDVKVSDDGVHYYSAIEGTVDLGADIYHAENYVPGSNTVCFPKTSRVRITLASSHVNDGERLAYQKTSIVDDTVVKQTYQMEGVKRKVIALGGIRLYNCKFASSSMHTKNLAPENGCKRIAVFCNTCLPKMTKADELKKSKPVSFSLYVNGKDYGVVPINSNGEGRKLISSSDSGYEDDTIEFIGEPIKTAQLKVNFNPKGDSSTAFVGNLKVCIG